MRAARDGVFTKVLRNSAWSAGASAVTALALFGETTILARYLGAATFGIYVLVTAYPEFIQQLLNFRVQDGLNRYLPGFFAQDRHSEAVAFIKLLWLLEAAVALATFLIVLATAGLATRLFVHNDSDSSLMIIYAVSVVMATFATAWGVLLRALGHFGLGFVSDASAVIFRLGLLVAVALAGGGLTQLMWARVGASALAGLVGAGLALPMLARVAWHARRAHIAVLREQRGELGRFLFNTNLVGTIRLASTKLDVLLVGALAGATAASLYRVALQFASVPLFLADALTASIFPAMSRAVAGKRWGEIRHLAFRSSLVVAVIAVPPSILVAVLGHPLLKVLVGPQFAAAGLPLSICLIGVIPYLIMFWLYSVLLVTGHVGVVVRIAAVSAVAQIATIVILVPPLGANGGAVAVAVLLNVTVALQLIFVRRRGLLAKVAPTETPQWAYKS